MPGDNMYKLKKTDALNDFYSNLKKGKNHDDAWRVAYFKKNFKTYTWQRFRDNWKKGEISTTNALELADHLGVAVSSIKGSLTVGSAATGKKHYDSIYRSDQIPTAAPVQMTLPLNEKKTDSVDELINETSQHLKNGVDLGMKWLRLICNKKGLR